MHLYFTCSLIFGFWQFAVSKHFGYSVDHQKSWHKRAESCSGRHQSPIAIDGEHALPLAIPALEMVGFDNLIPRPVSVTNTGHSVDIKPGRHFAKIFGALLDGKFEVEGIHFHWGMKNNRGSEHVINGMRFAMEMHIVTRNTLYNSTTESMLHPNGLAVLAFFFNVREQESSSLKPILQELNMIKQEGTRMFLSSSFTLGSLLSHDRSIFYTYRGSLTTPPCSEVVTWIVFPDPQPVSYAQMKEFRQLSTEDEILADNYRHIQSIGKRKVYVRKYPTETASLRNINYTSYSFWH